jgi:hypothetical protein
MPDDPENANFKTAELKMFPVGEIDWVPPQSEPEFSINYVHMGMSIWNISLHLGTILGANPDNGHLQVAKRVTVHLSPEFARALQLTLAQSLMQYENAFGKLRYPPTTPEAKTHFQVP